MFQRFLSLILLLGACATGASAYEVEALTTDTVGEPLPYVTYRIFGTDTVHPAATGLSDLDGRIAAGLPAAGPYSLRLSYTGMADAVRRFEVTDSMPTASLGDITMSESARVLQGITVTAQKPLVVKQIDRLGYDVQADPDMPTSQVSDILRKVPMVSVDADGTIKVNGSTDFKIYKNGRPNNSLTKNAKDILAAMPASMIKRVEVITDPGASFDAEGTSAVLNIVTNDNSAIKGVLGTANARYVTMNEFPEMSLHLTSEIDRVTFTAYGGYAHLGGRMTRNNQSSVTDYPSGIKRTEEAYNSSRGDITFFGLDSSWQPDTLNLFTLELGGYNFGTKTRNNGNTISTDASGKTVGTITTEQFMPQNDYLDINANFNWQHNTRRKGEVYTLSYLLSHTNQKNRSNAKYSNATGIDRVPYSAILSNYNLNFIEHTLQADWTRAFGRHTVEVGAKAIIRRNHSTNDFDYVDLQKVSNEFSHLTDIGALYAQYSVSLGKVNLRAGLRWEYSHLDASYPDGSGKDYSSNLSDWVPSAAASWQVNDANSLTFNFSTSINRPGISYLNPAVTVTPTSLSYGNPDLGSAARRSMKLTYMYIKPKINFNFSVAYMLVNNGIAEMKFLDDNDLINNTYGNIGHRRSLNFSAFAQWTPSKNTRVMFNGGVERSSASQEGMSLARWIPNGYLQVSQCIPGDVWLEASAFGWWGNLNDVYSYSTASFTSGMRYQLLARRAFLKNKNLNVSVGIVNPFGPSPSRRYSKTVNGDFRNKTCYSMDMANCVLINVSYRFGSLKSSVRKTAKSIENDDLIGRKTE